MILISVSSSSRWVAKPVAQRMQRHPLPDPGRGGRLMEQAVELAGGHRLTGSDARKQPALLQGYSRIASGGACLPPLPQQIEHLGRQHHVAVLAALGLLDPNNVLCPVDMLDLQPHHLTGAQATAIAETE